MKKLRSRGHIRAQVALVEPRSLGLLVCAFVAVLVERPAIEAAFIRRMAALPGVQDVTSLRVSTRFC